VQTIYARLEEILKADRLQRAQLFEGRLDALHKLLSSTETYTFRPKFQKPRGNVDRSIIGTPAGLKTVHGAVQNALSLVIDRIAPNAPARSKQVRVVTSGPVMYGPRDKELHLGNVAAQTKMMDLCDLAALTPDLRQGGG
jgi:hypothetical protein